MPKKKVVPSKITVEQLRLKTEVGIIDIDNGKVVFENDYPNNATPDQWIAAMTQVKKIIALVEVA